MKQDVFELGGRTRACSLDLILKKYLFSRKTVTDGNSHSIKESCGSVFLSNENCRFRYLESSCSPLRKHEMNGTHYCVQASSGNTYV